MASDPLPVVPVVEVPAVGGQLSLTPSRVALPRLRGYFVASTAASPVQAKQKHVVASDACGSRPVTRGARCGGARCWWPADAFSSSAAASRIAWLLCCIDGCFASASKTQSVVASDACGSRSVTRGARCGEVPAVGGQLGSMPSQAALPRLSCFPVALTTASRSGFCHRHLLNVWHCRRLGVYHR